MPQYLTPGVYIEEVPGAKPIEGVGTATGGFVGVAEKGPIGKAVLVTNWTQFIDNFGGYTANGNLAYAVNQFFTEGGTRCYVVRTCHYEDITNPNGHRATAATTALKDRSDTPKETLRVEALSAGSWGDGIGVVISNATSDPADAGSLPKFRLAVLYRGAEVENYDELTLSTTPGVVNSQSKYIKVTDRGSTSEPQKNRRPALSAKAFQGLSLTARARGLSVEVTIPDSNNSSSFRIVVLQAGSKVEDYANLKMIDVERRINSVSKYISASATDATSVPVATTTPTALPYDGLSGGWEGLRGTTFKDRAATALDTLAISAWQDNVSVDIQDATVDSTNAFRIVVRQNNQQIEVFDNLTIANVEQQVNAQSAFIEVDDLNSATPPPGNRPAATTGSVAISSGLADADFIGDASAKNGLHALDVCDDVNIVAIPDWPGDRETILAAYSYCANRGDCFFVADPPLGLTPESVLSFKQGTGSYAGNAFNSSYAALYYPWITVSDPLTDKPRLVPPSGAVIGTYSATDVRRGVHKAPAGVDDGYLNSAVGVQRLITKGEQELLNPAGINVIRSFPGTGIVVWGARTLSADPEFKYINVRRLLLFIEESIDQSTQWVVFEPNDRSLWAKVKRDVTAFLTTVWRDGALFGATAQEAFFVKIDDENNPPETRDLGRLVIDVGIAPVKPAEFVIFRITQKTQGAKA